MPYASNKGVQIHYEVAGEGLSLVLLHGFGVSGDAWHTGGHVAALSDEFQVITMDARGHGRSDKPHNPAAYSLSERVRDVTSALDAVGVETAHFLGFSLGGVTGFGLCKYAPSRFQSVIALGAHPYAEEFPEDFEEWGQRYINYGVEAAIKREARVSGSVSEKRKEELESRDWKALGAALLATKRIKGLSDGLSRSRIPYLLICGTEDPDHDLARRSANEFPNVSFIPLEGFDHHESRSRLDVLIPIMKDFFGSSPVEAGTHAI